MKSSIVSSTIDDPSHEAGAKVNGRAQRPPSMPREGKTKASFLWLPCKLIQRKHFLYMVFTVSYHQWQKDRCGHILSQWQVCFLDPKVAKNCQGTLLALMVHRGKRPHLEDSEGWSLLASSYVATVPHVRGKSYRNGHKQRRLSGIPRTTRICSLSTPPCSFKESSIIWPPLSLRIFEPPSPCSSQTSLHFWNIETETTIS